MGGRNFLGEFEQRVLLAILRCDAKAYPIEIRKEVTRASGHEPSRGAFYTTLDRLEAKQLVRWTAEGGDAGRDGFPQRRFTVTPEGVKALRASRRTLLELWRGLDVNATHVVHSGVSGNNGGCDTNPTFLEVLPNESSS